jgi:hypothetical protein
MRFTSLATGLLAVLGGAALAAEGDELVVTGDGVNLRSRPEAGAPVLLQIYRDESAVELAREGDWVRVRLPERDTAGWIHGSLVTRADGQPSTQPAVPAVPVQPNAPAASAPAPAPAATTPARPAPATPTEPAPPAGPGTSAEGPTIADGEKELAVVGAPGSEAALASFRNAVTYLNERALAAAGVELFVDVKVDESGGLAQVVATEAWNVVPEGGRQSYLNTLLDRWSAAVGSGRPARVEIVDESGRWLAERSTP